MTTIRSVLLVTGVSLLWSGGVCYRGYTVIESPVWWFNQSWFNDSGMIPKRIWTAQNYSTTGVTGPIHLFQDLPCDSDVKVSFYPRVRGEFTPRPTLETQGFNINKFTSKNEDKTLPPLIVPFLNDMRDCIEPRLLCPLIAPGWYELNCGFSAVMDLPNKEWKIAVEARVGKEKYKLMTVDWEFHLDDTPLARLKRPSEVQRRRRIQRGQKPVNSLPSLV